MTMLPCPFCGSTDLGLWRQMMRAKCCIACNECDAQGPWAGSREKAIAAWRRRVEGKP